MHFFHTRSRSLSWTCRHLVISFFWATVIISPFLFPFFLFACTDIDEDATAIAWLLSRSLSEGSLEELPASKDVLPIGVRLRRCLRQAFFFQRIRWGTLRLRRDCRKNLTEYFNGEEGQAGDEYEMFGMCTFTWKWYNCWPALGTIIK